MKNLKMVWSIYTFFFLLAVGAMSWVNVAVNKLETAKKEIRENAELEERVRLALWRMDSAASSIISFVRWKNPNNPESDYCLNHYKIDQQTTKVISNEKTDNNVNLGIRDEDIPTAAICKAVNETHSFKSKNIKQLIEKTEMDINSNKIAQGKDNSILNPTQQVDQSQWGNVQVQKNKGYKEYSARNDYSQSYNAPESQNRIFNRRSFNSNSSSTPSIQTQQKEQLQQQTISPPKNKSVTVATPTSQSFAKGLTLNSPLVLVMDNDNLYLSCSVKDDNGSDSILGFWMDWPSIKKQLEESCNDLLPQAQIVSIKEPNNYERRMASLPVTLEPGHLPQSFRENSFEGDSNTSFILLLAWTGILTAFAASGFLLHGANKLSKRRSTFVSAVTHELRTPLTTFRMYTDILLNGKLSKDKTNNYLQTMSTETDRLSHMVENVLAYSRLEKINSSTTHESFMLSKILDRCLESLESRCNKDNMTLNVIYDKKSMDTIIFADLAGIEHILFNLIDNACKYASSSSNTLIDLTFTQQTSETHISVRDRGPGIQNTEKLFKPFSKSVNEAALTQPGIGLGLALCKQFAKEMGGDLSYSPAPGHGACFTLKLK